MASGSSRRHAWESYGPLHAGYADVAVAPWDDSDDESAPVTASEAGNNLGDMLIRLRLAGTISAKQCCVLAHWASLAGAVGPVGDFGAPPDKQSGFYQQKLDRYMRVEEDPEKFYFLQIPGHDRSQASRCVHKTEVVPPHEALQIEVAADPSLLQRALTSAAGNEWSANYRKHPAVLAAPAGEGVLPLALYLDGVPYSKTDSFLGIWVYNLLSWKRHLVCVLRKSTMCHCGCRKWCSFWVVFQWLAWSFRALALGRNPAARHDDAPWESEDDHRAAAAGARIPRGAVCLLKGDWSEFCNTLGFPTWQTNEHPCLFCRVRKERLYDISNFSVLSFPAELKTTVGYRAAALQAERRVRLGNAAEVKQLSAALRFDKRKEGAHGRALIRDLPGLGLAKGDRLEPSKELPDVCALETVSVFPIVVTFWRMSTESWTKHRNPLFCDDICGIGIETLAVDTLHTLNLGIYQKMVARVWWLLLTLDVFEVANAAGGRANMDETVQNGILRLKLDLVTWYDTWEAGHPGVRLNRIEDLTVKTLGDRHGLMINAKAAVTRPLVLHAADLVERFAHRLSPEDKMLVPAARTLANFSELLRTAPQEVPPERTQLLLDTLKRYIVLAARAGIPPIPKLHLSMHLVHRTAPSKNKTSPSKFFSCVCV